MSASTSISSYLEWIGAQEKELYYRVQQWAIFNSFSYNTLGLKRLSNLLKNSFRVLGAKISSYQLPAQKVLTENGQTELRPLGQILILEKRPNAKIQVLLGGHYDTVFSSDHPFQECRDLGRGILNGPGVADMKGGLAIMLTALEAFERSPFAHEIGWKVIINPDEEIGSPGSSLFFEELAPKFNCALLFEPSFPDGAFVHKRQGSTTFTLGVYGQAAHVGRDFAQGRSAVVAMMHFLQKVEAFRKQESIILNVADVMGKGPVNIVPPFARCKINVRSSDDNLLQNLQSQLIEFMNECQENGIRMELVRENFRPPKHYDRDTEQLFKAYASCAHELGQSFQTRETGGVCDGNILASQGIPTLDTAGAIGGALHTSDEYIETSSLVERAKLAALFLMKLANKDITINRNSP